jgi:tRNA dimethylallyltransferase
LVVLVGPTGSGKTALSLAVAEHLGGEIVNCDSVAMYREFEIGTAKPSREERARVPHHLIDFVAPASFVTSGEYARMARETVREISERACLPIVVGGTGLYLRAMLEGLFPGPQRSEKLRGRLRQRAASKPPGYLHRMLRCLDVKAAGSIHPNDIPKLIRAIEVCLASRNRMTDLWQQGRDPLMGFSIVRIGLDPDRQALYGRINSRATKMFEAGLIDETRNLLERYGDDVWPLKALGYKQAVQVIAGEMDRDAALAAVQQAHRNYAKRQMTWFRREPNVIWFKAFGDDAVIQARVLEVIQKHHEP